MDLWQIIAERNDAIRRWAELEGKSPQMSDDLYQEHVPTRNRRARWPLAVLLLVLLAALAAGVCWCAYSG
jgi:hypothetical protein